MLGNTIDEFVKIERFRQEEVNAIPRKGEGCTDISCHEDEGYVDKPIILDLASQLVTILAWQVQITEYEIGALLVDQQVGINRREDSTYSVALIHQYLSNEV